MPKSFSKEMLLCEKVIDPFKYMLFFLNVRKVVVRNQHKHFANFKFSRRYFKNQTFRFFSFKTSFQQFLYLNYNESFSIFFFIIFIKIVYLTILSYFL